MVARSRPVFFRPRSTFVITPEMIEILHLMGAEVPSIATFRASQFAGFAFFSSPRTPMILAFHFVRADRRRLQTFTRHVAHFVNRLQGLADPLGCWCCVWHGVVRDGNVAGPDQRLCGPRRCFNSAHMLKQMIKKRLHPPVAERLIVMSHLALGDSGLRA